MARHRGAQLEGMARLFLLCTVLGMVEGSRKRDATPLSGFGLGLFTLGRVALALSVVGLLAYAVVPVVMPFLGAACVLSAALGWSSYLLMRGMPRVSWRKGCGMLKTVLCIAGRGAVLRLFAGDGAGLVRAGVVVDGRPGDDRRRTRSWRRAAAGRLRGGVSGAGDAPGDPDAGHRHPAVEPRHRRRPDARSGQAARSGRRRRQRGVGLPGRGCGPDEHGNLQPADGDGVLCRTDLVRHIEAPAGPGDDDAAGAGGGAGDDEQPARRPDQPAEVVAGAALHRRHAAAGYGRA